MTKRNRMKHPQGALVKRTRELLIASTLTQFEISKGTQIQTHWLSLFACDKIPDPSVNRIEALYTFLRGAPLDIG